MSGQEQPGTNINIEQERERAYLAELQTKPLGQKMAGYIKLSGPGWLQSAITLGGGSLAGSLYLGIIGGYQFMWLQPLMMVLGVLMLSVIAYVTLSTGERPFGAINRHINPVLGWGWLIAAMMANMVWAMPQFSLGTAALEQNLLPGVFGASKAGPYMAVALLFVIGAGIVWFYDSGSKGVKFFEVILKAMVGVVVVSFFGVVVAMSLSGHLPWGEIIAGFVNPANLKLLFQPSDGLQPFIDASGAKGYWAQLVLTSQQERMVAAAATAVGINMTFLLPYSMLRKGWGKEHRGLAAFDLSTGLFIPFLLATSCVVLAAACQFHGKFDEAQVTAPAIEAKGGYRKNLEARVRFEAKDKTLSKDEMNAAIDALPQADKELAAMLVPKDAFDLARSLEKLTGKGIAHYVFGIGVLGMAVSTIIILMLINGFCLTEMFGKPPGGTLHLIGCILPGLTGALGFLFLWGNAEARFWLAVPTSNFGMVLLPVAYITFFFMVNNRSLMGDQLPKGGKRILLNIAMIVAIGVAATGSTIALLNTSGKIPGTDMSVRGPLLAVVGLFIVAVLIGFVVRKKKPE